MCAQRRIFVSSGQRFGRLTVIDPDRTIINRTGHHERVCLVLCDCGTERVVHLRFLARGATRSCGCLNHEVIVSAHLQHGETKTRLHQIWVGMKQRCTNPRKRAYKDYGGRGITVCPEWQNDYRAFRDWSITHGYESMLSIDRIDNNGPYSPDNCRWIPLPDQARNKRSSRFFTCFGETKILADWMRDPRCAVNGKALARRLKLGWPFAKAITTPITARR